MQSRVNTIPTQTQCEEIGTNENIFFLYSQRFHWSMQNEIHNQIRTQQTTTEREKKEEKKNNKFKTKIIAIFSRSYFLCLQWLTLKIECVRMCV